MVQNTWGTFWFKDAGNNTYVDGWPILKRLHRENDLPAAIWEDGTQKWYKDGKLHRDNDLPAVIYESGRKVWFKEGKCHRENDLPAIIRPNGSKEWWVNGEQYNPQRK